MSTSPHAGHVGDLTWITEVDRRRNMVAIHATHGQYREANLSSSLWLAPDEAEKLGRALLDAVASWRSDEAAKAWTGGAQ
ncbi:hypothetical protein [Reyranella sp.]|uniref:hypothetical protein n=1 Tax=Reyranella sp. TaxID=1929291 RepID=UPI0037848D72